MFSIIKLITCLETFPGLEKIAYSKFNEHLFNRNQTPRITMQCLHSKVIETEPLKVKIHKTPSNIPLIDKK